MPAPAVFGQLPFLGPGDPTPLAPLQQTYGGVLFPLTGVLDDFNRADGGLGSNWTSPPWGAATGCTISSNQMVGAGGTNTAAWNTAFGPDCEMFVDIAAGASGTVALYLRRQSLRATGVAVPDGYKLTVNLLTFSWTISSIVQGSPQNIWVFNWRVVAGDSIGFRIVGNDLTCFYREAGDGWILVAETSDSTFPNVIGYSGLDFQTSGTKIDNFGGGSLTPSVVSMPFPPLGAINNPFSPNMRLFPSPLISPASIPTFPVSQTFSVFFEVVQALTDTSSEPIEAEQSLAVTKSEPLEAIVDGIQQTKSEPWEALLAITSTKSEAWEALLGLAATKSEPWDALQAITSTKSDPWEALLKVAAVGNQASYETLLGLRAYTDMSGLVQEFYDDFSALDASRWVQDLGAGSTAAISGVLRFTCSAGQKARLSTIPSYRPGGFQFRLATGPDDISDGKGSIFLAEWKRGHFGFQIERTGAGQRRFFAYANNNGTSFINVASFPIWWRVRYDLELRVIVFETSDDAVIWTTRMIESNIDTSEDPFGSDPTSYLNQFDFEYDNNIVGASATKIVEVDDTTIWGAGSLPQIDANKTIAATKSDPWEALQAIQQTKIDSWEALLGIAKTNSEAWDALQGIAKTNSEVWEALQGIAGTKADPWEATKPLSATAANPWEALVALAATRSNPYEALKALVATASDPWEAIVGGIAQTKLESWEALLGIAKTNSEAWGALQGIASTKSDIWEALQSIAGTKVDSWDALKALSTTASDPWESIVGGIQQTKQESWEALSGMSKTNAEAWEALLAITKSTSEAWEALLGIAASKSDVWEALLTLAATKSEVWESLQSIAATKNDPWEAIVGGIQQTKLEPWEALLTIAATKSDPYEALQKIAAITSAPFEAQGNVVISQTASLVWEAMQEIATSGAEVYEALLAIAAIKQDSYEALLAITTNRSDVWEATGAVSSNRLSPWEAIVSGIISTRLNPWEANLAITASKSEAWEALLGIASIKSNPWDAQGEVVIIQTASLPWDALQAIASPRAETWEATVGGINSIRLGPYEALQGVAVNKPDVLEALQGIVSFKSDPYEVLNQIFSSTSDPYDVLRQIAATSLMPWETSQKIASSLGVPYEALRTILSTAVSPWDATGVVTFSVSQTGILPLDVLSGIRAVPVLSIESLRNLVKPASGPYEVKIKLSKSATEAYETTIGIRNPALLPWETVIGVITQISRLPWEAAGRLDVVTETGLHLDGTYRPPNFEDVRTADGVHIVVIPSGDYFLVVVEDNDFTIFPLPSQLMEGFTETGLDIGET